MILRADTGGFNEEFSGDAAELNVEMSGTDDVSGEFSENPGFCSGETPADAVIPVQGLNR